MSRFYGRTCINNFFLSYLPLYFILIIEFGRLIASKFKTNLNLYITVCCVYEKYEI